MVVLSLSGFGQVKADFDGSPLKGCPPLTVKLADKSTGSVTSYFWDLGNGNTSTLKNPSAIYILPGTYNVKLTVKDGSGDSNTIVKNQVITVFKSPTAAASSSKRKACIKEKITFSDLSVKGDSNIVSWRWDFGDGTIVSTQNPVHSYTASGTYSIRLAVTDKNGCESSVTLNNHITINSNPSSDFDIGQDYSCVAPHTTSFTAKGTGTSYDWDFGDGNTGSNKTTNNTFANKGTYNVKLKVSDAVGCSSETTKVVNIKDLVVDFTVARKKICTDEFLSFVSSSSPSIPGAVYTWEMGDGLTVKGSLISYKYAKEGFKTIKLTVKTQNCTASITKTNHIEVVAPPKIDIYVSDTILCDKTKLIEFTDNSKNVAKRKWTFSTGGEPDNNKTVKKQFISGGIVNYTLEVENSTGCIATYNGSVKVSNIYADYTADSMAFDSLVKDGYKRRIALYGDCAPFTLNLKENVASFFKVTNVKWDMGDGSIINGSNAVQKKYLEKDTLYCGVLWAEDLLGCKDSIAFAVQMGGKTYPNFIPDNSQACNGDTVRFKNLSQDSSVITKVLWSFGKATYNPKHIFNRKPDTMAISLTTFHHGCKSDTTISNFELLGPFVEINSDYNPCSKDSILLKSNSCEYDSIAWYRNGFPESISNDTAILVAAEDKASYTLVAWNDNGCTHKDSFMINLKENPIISYGFPDIDDCAPTIGKFTVSSNEIQELVWDFGNGDSSKKSVVDYEFKRAGQYFVKVVVTTRNGCVYSQSKPYNIPGVFLSGNVEVKDTCMPFNIVLTDSVYDPNRVETVYWEVNGEKIQHDSIHTPFLVNKANKDGVLTINLYGEDTAGCTSSLNFDLPASGPYGEIWHLAKPECDSLLMDFTLINKTVNNPLVYWTINGVEPKGARNQRIEPKIPFNKEVKVKMKITDNYGCSSTVEETFFYPKVLEARVFADTTGSYCPPLLVNFSDSSRSNTKIVDWKWDFGDGTGSSLQNPGKLYLVPGSFGVSLKITDEKGCTDSVHMADFVLVRGPRGTYSFNPDSGCYPLNVDFASVTTDALKIDWDLGDGTVKSGANLKHEYARIGSYIPLLTLGDTFGCKYTLPPIDTIHVYGYPKVDVAIDNMCFGDSVRFTSTVDSAYGSIVRYEWNLGDGTIYDSINPVHLYSSGKGHSIQVVVENDKGCLDTLNRHFNLYEPKAAFDVDQDQYCIGQWLKVTDKSTSDTIVESYHWKVEGLTQGTGKFPQIHLDSIGYYDLFLHITDAANCVDSVLVPLAIGIGDTTAPKPPHIHRVSVLNDNAIDITFSLDSILDFYRYELLRETTPGVYTKVSESTVLSDTLLVDNALNTLHQSHCFKLNKENFCNIKTDVSKLKKHCTVEATATGALNAVRVDWNHYVGWNAIDSYYVFREERLIPDSFTLIGKVDGSINSFTDSSTYCREQLFYRILAKQEANSNVQWSWSDTTGASPLFSNSVPPNEIWRTTVMDDEYAKLEWLPTKGSRFPIAYYKLLVKQSDGSYRELPDNIAPGINSIDYKKTQVDDHNYYFQMYGVDVCQDRSDLGNEAKTILLNVSSSVDFRPELSWTKYRGWAEGVEEYIVEFIEEDGSYTEIGRTNALDTNFVDEVSPFNCIPNYCYRVTAVRNQPDNYPDSSHSVISHSNEDCAPVVSKLFAPNAFTLNADGLNDEFEVKGIYIKQYNIKIYTRWGEKVYDSDSFKVHWDGIANSTEAHQSVFVYVIEAFGVDGEVYRLSGDITVLK